MNDIKIEMCSLPISLKLTLITLNNHTQVTYACLVNHTRNEEL